eukprot:220268-Chlamydomonas_euryale.AAC.1
MQDLQVGAEAAVAFAEMAKCEVSRHVTRPNTDLRDNSVWESPTSRVDHIAQTGPVQLSVVYRYPASSVPGGQGCHITDMISACHATALLDIL